MEVCVWAVLFKKRKANSSSELRRTSSNGAVEGALPKGRRLARDGKFSKGQVWLKGAKLKMVLEVWPAELRWEERREERIREQIKPGSLWFAVHISRWECSLYVS